MPICKGARLKIERAGHHIADLESRIDRLKERLAIAAHIDPDSGLEYIKCDFASVEDGNALHRLAVIIGDAVHNLRCALDHVWFETISRLIPAGEWDRTKFPAYPTSERLELELQRMKINASTPNFYGFLVSVIQPYDRGDYSIRPVHKLDIRDKHRLLIPVVHYSSIGDIYLEDQNGEIHKGSTWGTTLPLPHVVGPFERGIHIKDPGQVSFDVMFEEGGPGSEASVVFTLGLYSKHIVRIVELFENFVET